MNTSTLFIATCIISVFTLQAMNNGNIPLSEQQKIQKLFLKNREQTLHLIQTAKEQKLITKIRANEFTIGSFNGKTGWAVLYFPPEETAYNYPLNSLLEIITQNNINDTDTFSGGKNNDDGPTDPQESLVKEGSIKKKSCCCSLY